MNLLASFFGARWLGHGRATELYFATVAAVFAVLMVAVPHAAQDSQATRGLGIGIEIPIAFATASICSFAGLIGNMRAWPGSQTLRFTGAVISSMLYIWYILRFFTIGTPATMGMPFAIAALPFTLRVMVMALAGLPVLGAPGRR